jgi:steroid delta-isomerase-like uncharacterized protein
MDSVALVQSYYAAFNAGDFEGMLALLTDDVVHDINQGERESGIQAFSAFMARMNGSYPASMNKSFLFPCFALVSNLP